MVNKTIQDTSARRALTSSGVVGLVTAFLSKGLDVELKVSLPIAVAAAIGLDYATNVREAENAIEITLDSLHEYVDELLTEMQRDEMVGADPFQQAQIEAEYAEQRQRFEAGLSVPQRSYVEESLLNGFVAMSWLGYIASMTVGEMILIRAPQRQRAVDAARNLSARVAAVAARAWFMVVVGMAAPGVYGLTLRIQQAVARGVANYAQPIVENQLWRLRQYFADAGDEVGAARVDQVGEQIVQELLEDAVQGIAGEVVTIVIAQARQEMADALVEVADDENLVILSGTDEEMQEAQDVLAELPSLPPTPVRPQKQKIILVRQKHDIPEQGDMLETERISQRLYPKDEVIGLRFGQQVGYGRDGDTDWFEPTAILDISSDLVSAVTDLSRQFTTGGDQLQDLPNQFAMADEDTFFGGPQENVELGQVHEGPRGGDGGWEWRDASGLTPEQGNPWKFSTFYLNTDLEGQVTFDELYDVVLQALQDPTMTAPTDVPGRLLVVRKLIKTQLGLSSSDSKKVRNALAGMLDFRINLLQIIADFKQYWKDFAAWQAPQSTVVSESWATQEITGIQNEQQPPSDSTGAVVEDDWD